MTLPSRTRPRGVSLLLASVLLLAAAQAAWPSVASATPTEVDCVSAPTTALQNAIGAAPDGAVLNIHGTCVGPFTIPDTTFDSAGLTLQGVGTDPTLDGNDAGTTLTIEGNNIVTVDALTITGGHGADGPPLSKLSTVFLAGWPGGIDNWGILTLTHSTVTGNVGGMGSTGYVDSPKGGPGGRGGTGGVRSNNEITVIDSTITGNTGGQGGTGGGLAGDGGEGGPGGISRGETFGSTFNITASTIVGNTGGAAGVGWTNGVDSGAPGTAGVGGIGRWGTPTLTATILAANDPGGTSDCTGATITSGGYNVIGSATGCTFSPLGTDQAGTSGSPLDPGLSPLGSVGGTTDAMAPTSSSVAIDHIPGGDPACQSDDQRGSSRPQGAGCEVGAVEVAGATLTIKAPRSVTPGKKVAIKGVVSSAAPACAHGRTVALVKGAAELATTTSSDTGAYVFHMKVRKRLTVRATVAEGGGCAEAASPKTTIVPG